MKDITWTHTRIELILQAIPVQARSIVDIGCGRGIIGALCRVYREPGRLVGIDAYEPYLEHCRRYRFYDELTKGDLRSLPLPFGDGEFDVATCVEVLEHLPKKEGLALLDELERIARRVVITTPNIYYSQEEFDTNPHQKHLSLWKVPDFSARGYRVYGTGSLKLFGRTLRYFSPAFGSMTKMLPRLSSNLLCIGEVEG